METKNERAATPRILVIDRSKWLRGEGGYASRLIRDRDGKMCCLGFLGLSCGIERDAMLDRHRPDELGEAAWPDWLIERTKTMAFNAADTQALMRDNDDTKISASEREEKIAAIFAEHGVEVRFVDSTEQPPAGPSASASLAGHEQDKEEK